MARYELNVKPKKKRAEFHISKRTAGITLIAVSSICFFFAITSLVPFMKSFLLGVFGIFLYPLCILSIVVGMALVNNKKYLLSKRYIVFMSLAVFSLIGILQVATTVGFDGNFGQFLAYCYAQKITVSGFIGGLVIGAFKYLLTNAGAIALFSISLIIFVALIIDYLYYTKNDTALQKPAKLSGQPIKIDENSGLIINKADIERVKKQFTPITLDAQITASKETLSAKEKLGLLNKDVIIKGGIQEKPLPIEQKQKIDYNNPESLKNYILSKPTQAELGNYSFFKNKEKINEEISKTKQSAQDNASLNATRPQKIVHDEISNSFRPNLSQSTSFILDPIISKKPTEDDVFEIKDTNGNVDNSILNSITKPEIKTDFNISEPTIVPDQTRNRIRNNFSQVNMNEYEKIEANSPIKETEIENVSEPQKIIEYQTYIKPPLDIFTTVSINPEELNEDIIGKRAQLEYALETFNVPAKVIAVIVGPAVTRYELEMPPGISVKKLIAHSDDIALTLASNGDIRIEAPIPGRSAVGIEVPNDKIATVGIKEILSSKEFNMSRSPLTLALGKDIGGNIKICDLIKMPHLLVAGATNSGKSVCLNSIILSLIYRNSPDELKLILIDPKRVEFSLYNNLPHLILPNVITESDKAINSLQYCVDEMERRYMLFQKSRSRNIQEYNVRTEILDGIEQKMPYLVIVIDELADLMCVGKKDVEERVLKLAQKARAAGIHMVLATQRPSVDVITGLIKANFPSRISFALTSFADSKTILDQGGADKLLGKGDMLFLPSDASSPKRIQGCFMEGKEVEAFVEFIKQNNVYDYDSEIENHINCPKQSLASSLVDGQPNEIGYDQTMAQALKFFIENGQASITILQRKMGLGYPRAARLVDQMETAGYISASDGSKPRSVYMTMEEWNKLFSDSNN